MKSYRAYWLPGVIMYHSFTCFNPKSYCTTIYTKEYHKIQDDNKNIAIIHGDIKSSYAKSSLVWFLESFLKNGGNFQSFLLIPCRTPFSTLSSALFWQYYKMKYWHVQLRMQPFIIIWNLNIHFKPFTILTYKLSYKNKLLLFARSN